jgi:hypothetical protein
LPFAAFARRSSGCHVRDVDFEASFRGSIAFLLFVGALSLFGFLLLQVLSFPP